MCYFSEVKRMKEIVEKLNKGIDDILAVTYSYDEIVDILMEHFPEGTAALTQGTDLIIVLNDFKSLMLHTKHEIVEADFDKIRKAVIDYDHNKKFSFK